MVAPGTRICSGDVVERTLQAADKAWDAGHFDVSELAVYLSDLLTAQLTEAP